MNEQVWKRGDRTLLFYTGDYDAITPASTRARKDLGVWIEPKVLRRKGWRRLR